MRKGEGRSIASLGHSGVLRTVWKFLLQPGNQAGVTLPPLPCVPQKGPVLTAAQ